MKNAYHDESELMRQLASSRLFIGMSGDDMLPLIRLIMPPDGLRMLVRGEVFVHEGMPTRWMVLVLSGSLRIYESGAGGERHLVRTVEPGEILGATQVAVNHSNYPGMVVANEATDVVLFELERIRRVWGTARYAKFFENLYSIVSTDVLICWRKLAILNLRRAEDRLMLYLRGRCAAEGQAEVMLPFARLEDCARYLGLTRTGLFLAISRLVRRGEIARLGRKSFRILSKC